MAATTVLNSRHEHLQWRVGYLRAALETHRGASNPEDESWLAAEADFLMRIDAAESEIAVYESAQTKVPPSPR